MLFPFRLAASVGRRRVHCTEVATSGAEHSESIEPQRYRCRGTYCTPALAIVGHGGVAVPTTKPRLALHDLDSIFLGMCLLMKRVVP